jgi:hypothetical protein
LTFLNGNFDFLLLKLQGSKFIVFLLHVILAMYLAYVGWNFWVKRLRYNSP